MLTKSKWKYGWHALTGDVCGGIIAALIAIPYGLAMASLMGLPPVLGLFTSIITAPATALLGRNPVLIGGTASATVPFIALAVKEQGIGGAAKVTIVSAIFMMMFCVLRLGRYISKVPHSVVSGFSCGIGAMMVISQLNTITGVAPPTSATSSNMVWLLLGWLGSLHAIQFAPMMVGLITVAGAAVSAKWSPKAPAPLVGVAMAVIVAQIFGVREAVVGVLKLELPPFAGFAWTPSDVYKVLPAGFGLAIVTSVNLLITSRVVEHFRGRHKQLKAADADTELGAYSIANLCAGMFGAPLSVGIPARSLANLRCGGNSRLSILIHAGAILFFLSAGSAFIASIPLTALAGVVVFSGICLLDWSTWRRLRHMRRVDAAAFLSTAVAVLVVNALAAVMTGCLVYALHWTYSKLAPPLQLQPARD